LVRFDPYPRPKPLSLGVISRRPKQIGIFAGDIQGQPFGCWSNNLQVVSLAPLNCFASLSEVKNWQRLRLANYGRSKQADRKKQLTLQNSRTFKPEEHFGWDHLRIREKPL
jgi:hypothetical protein